jgi:CRP-like cAMP-binding protein
VTASRRILRGPGAAVVARKLSLHSDLSQEARRDLGRFLGAPHSVARGRLIAEAGDETDVVTVLESGVACRTTVLPTGARQIHAIILPGDAADAETTLLERRNDNLQAMSACSVWSVPKSRLKALPRTGGSLSEAFAREAIINAEIAREWIVNLGRRSADQRIAHLICELCTRMDVMGIGSGEAYPFIFTQQDISDAQGLTAVHVNRVLQQLKAKGLITLKTRSLVVLDRKGLEEVGLFDPAYLHFKRAQAA